MPPSQILTGAHIIPGDGQDPIPNARIEIENGRITSLTPNGPSTASTLDLEGRYLLPGLIDTHVHIVLDGGPDQLANYARFNRPYFAFMAARHIRHSLMSGITTLRDVGGMNGLEFDIRRAVQNNLIPGPRLVLAGALVTSTSPGTAEFIGMYRPADGADEVRKAAREQLKLGADLVKVQATGSVSSATEEPGAPQMTLEELKAAVEIAKMAGKPVASHCHGNAGIRLSVEAGCKTIEHCTYLDEETADLMVQHNAFFIPTFAADMQIKTHRVEDGIPAHIIAKSADVIRARQKGFKLALEKNIRIAMGTDAGTNYNRHGENGQELVYMVEMGMTPMQAIVASTSSAAEACNLSHLVGTVEPGKLADLIVLDQNPLENISAVQQISEVFLSGRRINREALRALDTELAP
ncbi:MAG: amidohydrolase family protein [bacterium]|nr:amidohydrolase family protein [bacterium]